ncbi:MAG: hypothetical protein ABI360_00475 [Allobranchiibius sp.]
MILGRRWAAPAFWAAAVVLAVLAAIGGAGWGLAQAPSFEGEDNNGAPATTASHFIYSVFGAAICGLAILAVASGIFFFLWARQRRADGSGSRDDGSGSRDDAQNDDMDIDEVADMFDEDDEPFDGQASPAEPRGSS